MADYNRDQMERDERTGRRVLGQYDPQMRYVEKLGQEPGLFLTMLDQRTLRNLLKT